VPEGDDEMKFRVVLQKDEDGVMVAEVPALPGCISQGATRDEALSNIREAISGYLDSLKAHGSRSRRHFRFGSDR
jgi:predicted RNase H-like HicB family nuclease